MVKQTTKNTRNMVKTANKTVKKAVMAEDTKVKKVDFDADTTTKIVIQNKIDYTPKVSVIIPVYNVEKYLAQCLDSVINQTMKDIEIICVNDGSTDGSLKILQEYAKKDDRISIINQKNSGLSIARNNAMKIAHGEYFDFLDSDDYLVPDALEVLYDYCKNNDLDMLSFSGQNFDDGSNVMKPNEYWDFLYLPEKIEFKKVSFQDCLPFMEKMAVSSCLTVYKRSFVQQNNIIFPEGVCFEDNVFFYKSLTKATNIGLLNQKLYCRRLHPGAITQNRASHVYDIIKITDLLLEYLKSINLDKDVFDKISEGYLNTVSRTYKNCVEKRLYRRLYHRLFQKYRKNGNIIGNKLHYLKIYLLFPYYLFACLRMKLVVLPVLKKTNNKIKVDVLKGNIRNNFNTQIDALKSCIQNQEKQVNMLKDQFDKMREDFLENKYFLLSELHKYNKKFPFVIPYKAEIEQWYSDRFGQADIDNPQTYNEKIQWSKIYDSNPIKTKLADKYLVRDWIAKKIGEKYLIPLLGVYDSFEEIDFDSLPDQFVIKCNHGCAYNIIVKDKSKLNLNDVKYKLKKWMAEDFTFKAGFELHYHNIPHKIIIEKYIENTSTGGDLYDYKFWCFDGKVEYIQFLSERNVGGLKMSFYDKKWNKQDFVYTYPLDQKNIEKPDNLNKMINLAEELSKGFNHVRVDFYRMDDGTIYFGEMTFTAASGACRWSTQEINEHMGKLFKLPKRAYNINTGEYYDLPKRK